MRPISGLLRAEVGRTVFCITCLFALALPGCAGGGTTGTGVEFKAVLIEGQVFTPTGAAVSEGNVRVADSEQLVQFNQDGTFALVSDIPEEGLALTMTVKGSQSSIKVEQEDVGEEGVLMQIEVNATTGEMLAVDKLPQ